MSNAHEVFEAAASEIGRLRKLLKKARTKQVQSKEEQAIIKATALAWFNNHRSVVSLGAETGLLASLDEYYKALLAAADRSTSRQRYDSMLKQLKGHLAEAAIGAAATPRATKTSESPPSFASLVPDPAMQAVLNRRWAECRRCIDADAPLAATVMMGGLLETLLLARVNREPNKKSIFSASTAPKDRRSTKPLALNEWTLRNYIDVAHELGWISPSARDVGEILRDYRNYIHPHKELTHGVQLVAGDAALFWEVAKAITRQLVGNST